MQKSFFFLCNCLNCSIVQCHIICNFELIVENFQQIKRFSKETHRLSILDSCVTVYVIYVIMTINV